MDDDWIPFVVGMMMGAAIVGLIAITTHVDKDAVYKSGYIQALADKDAGTFKYMLVRNTDASVTWERIGK